MLDVAAVTLASASLSFIVALCFGEFYRADMFPYAIGYACIFFVSTLCCYKAYEIGPVTGVALFSNAGLVITVFYGVLIFDEPFGKLGITGVACMCIALVLLSFPDAFKATQSTAKKRYNKLWILLGLLIMLANSTGALLLKSRQTKAGGMDAFAFMSLCYVCIFLVSAMTYVGVARKQKQIGRDFKMLKTQAGALMLQSTGNAGTNMLATYLSTRVNSAVLYPVQLGGGFVLTVLFGFFLFKEKVTPYKVLGLILGVSAIVLLNI